MDIFQQQIGLIQFSPEKRQAARVEFKRLALGAVRPLMHATSSIFACTKKIKPSRYIIGTEMFGHNQRAAFRAEKIYPIFFDISYKAFKRLRPFFIPVMPVTTPTFIQHKEALHER